jgi:hypothetical protein
MPEEQDLSLQAAHAALAAHVATASGASEPVAAEMKTLAQGLNAALARITALEAEIGKVAAALVQKPVAPAPTPAAPPAPPAEPPKPAAEPPKPA